MIARIVIPLLLVIVLSDVYIDAYFFRKRIHVKWFQRLAWWIPTIFLVVYTSVLASIRNFAPANLTWLYTYLFLLGAIAGPKAVFSFCSLVGSLVQKTIAKKRRNYGHGVGFAIGIVAFAAFLYGFTFGFTKIKVRHETLYVHNLPKNFDGYRIVHVSDLHVGTFTSWRTSILEDEMDSIKRINPDLILFTGDLQNMRPSELLPVADLLKQGMKNAIAVRGNHDYTEYVKLTQQQRKQQNREFEDIVRNKLGWNLLQNSHIAIHKGNDSIIIEAQRTMVSRHSHRKPTTKRRSKGCNRATSSSCCSTTHRLGSAIYCRKTLHS